jgi:hypothetical protein
MCVTGTGPGEVVDSCEYEVEGTGQTRWIDLRGQEFAVEVYELASGELIEEYTEQVGGACPSTVFCTTYDDTSVTCPDAVDAITGRDDLAAIFSRW